MTALTPDAVLTLAPDAGSAKAGKGLATPGKWPVLAHAETVIWGECQGSGKDPYRTSIDLTGMPPGFKCSCPSRKFPCKHALALLLLHVTAPTAFSTTTTPDWVGTWLTGRAARQEKSTQATAKAADPAAQAKRRAAREQKLGHGLQELALWLRDLARAGLATAPARPHAYWDTMAARLIDAQAPGAARLVRELPALVSGGDGWSERTLARLGKLHLLTEAWTRQDALRDDERAEVRTATGESLDTAAVLAAPPITDDWAVLGQSRTQEEHVTVRRTWLRARTHGHDALLLDFGAGPQGLPPAPTPGTIIHADLHHAPGTLHLRALLGTTHGSARPLAPAPHAERIEEALSRHARLLARNPWLDRSPMLLADVTVHPGTWTARDGELELPLARHGTTDWTLLALTGGHPHVLFGEWNGEALTPLTVHADGVWHVLTTATEGAA